MACLLLGRYSTVTDLAQGCFGGVSVGSDQISAISQPKSGISMSIAAGRVVE